MKNVVYLIFFCCGCISLNAQQYTCPVEEGSFRELLVSENTHADPKNGLIIESGQDSVRSVTSGVVVGVVNNESNRVTIAVQHNDSISIAYMYLLSSFVKKGDQLTANQLLGVAPMNLEERYEFNLALWIKGERIDPRVLVPCK